MNIALFMDITVALLPFFFVVFTYFFKRKHNAVISATYAAPELSHIRLKASRQSLLLFIVLLLVLCFCIYTASGVLMRVDALNLSAYLLLAIYFVLTAIKAFAFSVESLFVAHSEIK